MKRLLGSLAFAPNLEESPYADLINADLWNHVGMYCIFDILSPPQKKEKKCKMHYLFCVWLIKNFLTGSTEEHFAQSFCVSMGLSAQSTLRVMYESFFFFFFTL